MFNLQEQKVSKIRNFTYYPIRRELKSIFEGARKCIRFLGIVKLENLLISQFYTILSIVRIINESL